MNRLKRCAIDRRDKGLICAKREPYIIIYLCICIYIISSLSYTTNNRKMDKGH